MANNTAALSSVLLGGGQPLPRPARTQHVPRIEQRSSVSVSVQHTASQPTAYRASAGTVAEQAAAQVEQILPRLGLSVQDPRVSLVLALGAQTGRTVEEGLLSLVGQVNRYTSGARRNVQPSSWEEAFMAVPDLETIPYTVVGRFPGVEIRDVESYMVAEVRMSRPSQGFDFAGSSEAFNTLAGYLFGKNKARESMEMTTPVVSRRDGVSMEMTTPVISSRGNGRAMEMTTPVLSRRDSGEAMEMTTPVINAKDSRQGWSMSFVIPSEFNESNIPIPEDPSVTIRRIPARTVAVSVFSGFVTDDDVAKREMALRRSVAQLEEYAIAPGAEVEVAQYNPPFTLPFMRRNEIALEVTKD